MHSHTGLWFGLQATAELDKYKERYNQTKDESQYHQNNVSKLEVRIIINPKLCLNILSNMKGGKISPFLPIFKIHFFIPFFIYKNSYKNIMNLVK